MDVHKNARTTPHRRALIACRVAAGPPAAAGGRQFGVCDRTVHKWVPRAGEGVVEIERLRRNWHRRHTALNGQPPVSMVAAADNLLRLHS